jgi:CP family cyanate transporter-like MFS transporter
MISAGSLRGELQQRAPALVLLWLGGFGIRVTILAVPPVISSIHRSLGLNEKGITALTLTLLGYGVGLLRQYVVTPSPILPVVLVGASTTVGVLFYGVVRFLLGFNPGALYLIKVAVLAGVYNAILTPLLFPPIRRVAKATRANKVFRW